MLLAVTARANGDKCVCTLLAGWRRKGGTRPGRRGIILEERRWPRFREAKPHPISHHLAGEASTFRLSARAWSDMQF